MSCILLLLHYKKQTLPTLVIANGTSFLEIIFYVANNKFAHFYNLFISIIYNKLTPFNHFTEILGNVFKFKGKRGLSYR